MENSFPGFEQMISSIPDIGKSDLDILREKFRPKIFSKNEFIGREGETARYTGYVESGCVSNYRILTSGKKSINHFAFEDWWVGDLESFLQQTPAKSYWLTLEETHTRSISKTDFDWVMRNIPPFQVFYLKKTQSAFLKEMENADRDKSETAIEKYERMERDYPKILQRVPNYEVAAYLGIAPESLSRIRKKRS